MVAGEALLISCLAFVFAAPIGVLVAHLERGLFIRAGMVPDGLHLIVGWLPFACGLVAAVITTQARGLRQCTPRLPHPPDRRAPRSDGSASPGLVGQRHRRARRARRRRCRPGRLRARLGRRRRKRRPRRDDDPHARRGAARATARVAVRLAARPAARGRQSRHPGMLARANTRANLRRAASVATPVMLAISLDLHDPVRQIGASAADRPSRRPADRGRIRPARARRTRPAARPWRQPHAACPESQHASGSIATSVVVAADGANLRSFPARGVDASTLAGVIDLGVRSGSLTDLTGKRARRQQQQRARRLAGTSATRSSSGSATARRPRCESPPLTRGRWGSASSSCRAHLSNGTSPNRSTTPSSSRATPGANPAELLARL